MIFFILILIIIGLGLIFPKSKFVLALGFLLLFIVSTHFQAGNDISNLQDSFSASNVNSEEEERSLVFYSLFLYLNSVGFSFYQFRCIDFAIWGSAIYLLIIKYAKYPSYVISCCILFPALTFASQMRNGLSVAFFYFAIISLFNSKHKVSGIIAYILLIIVAGMFHYLGFVFLIGLVALLPISNHKLLKYILIICGLVFILYNGGILYYCVSLFSPYYAENYFLGQGQSVLHFVFLTSGIIVNYKFSVFTALIIKRHKNEYTTQDIHFSEFVSRLNTLSFVFLPLLWTNGSIYRIYQNLFILTVVTVANASMTYISGERNQGYAFRFAYFCFFIFVSAFHIYWQGEFFTFFNSIRI